MALSLLASREAAVQRHETSKPPTAIGYGEEEFGYRKWESVRTHVNRFNGGQTTHKTGPRGGKIKSTVYKDWVAAHGGEWVGFQWRPL